MDAEDIYLICADLDRLVDQARWAHTHGYAKTGRGLDAARGGDLSKPESERMSGPRYDIEVGAHLARTAYRHACRTVHRSNLILARALLPTTSFQPEIVKLTPYEHPTQLARAAHALKDRLLLADPKLHAGTLRRVASAIDGCVRRLSRALDAGPPEGIAFARCKTCQIRPQAERAKEDGTSRPSKAGECHTCAEYRVRNGRPRPISLDTGPIREAKAAQARRIARGEHWGVA